MPARRQAAREPHAAPVPRRAAVSTLIFSVATGLSRVAGLIREVVAANLYGTTGLASAFTLAFQIPNLLRALVADAALSSAFVPVFTELLEKRRHKEAVQLASALAGLLLVALGVLCVVSIALAGWVVPLFTGPRIEAAGLDPIAVALTQVMFPIVVLLGLNGLVVGILNASDHYSIPAIAPLVWNVVIIAAMVAITPLLEGDDRIYAYAIGILLGTVVQFAMSLPVLGRVGVRLRLSFDWSDPRIRQVLTLMLPVSLGLGLINVDLLINTLVGGRVSQGTPAAIEKAFRIYMLPQGMFSVAVATVVFPALARYAAAKDLAGMRRMLGTGGRQILLLLIPSAVACAVLAEPMVRLLYEGGRFGEASVELVATALRWFSLSLPFAGLNLLLTRTFFSLQRPWQPTRLALGSLVVNVIVSLALYGPLGIAGVVVGTAVASAVMTAGQAYVLHGELGGIETARTLRATLAMGIASALLGLVAWGTWTLLDGPLGASKVEQAIALGVALALGGAVYLGAVLALRIPEARQIVDLLLRRRRPAT